MLNPPLRGTWPESSAALRQQWPRLTAEDLAGIAGDRDTLTHRLRERYGRTFGEWYRDVTEFDQRDVWAANMARVSLGIPND